MELEPGQKLYYLFLNDDSELIGQTTDKGHMKLYKKRLKKTGDEYHLFKVGMKPDEAMDLLNFHGAELSDIEPYFDSVYTERELSSCYYYVSQTIYDILAYSNAMSRLNAFVQFTDEEKAIIDKVMEYIDLMHEDLSEQEDDYCGSSGLVYEEYFDLPQIIEDMNKGKIKM